MKVTDVDSGAVAEGSEVSFGRGAPGTPVDLVLSDDPGLSRLAGVITESGGGLLVTSHQRAQSGFLEVLTPGGHVRARLPYGSSFMSREQELRIRLLVSAGPRLDLHVEGDRAQDGDTVMPAPPAATADDTYFRFTEASVLRPERGKEWQTVAAIACAKARFGSAEGAVPTHAWMVQECAAWFGMPRLSSRWVSDRYDAALNALNMPVHGAGDKLARLVPAILGSELIEVTVLRTVYGRLR